MPLYRANPDNTIAQLKQTTFAKERDLQKLFEANLEQLLGVRFIASEFTTGDRQRGRIDTLGLDQDGYPTIIEYKRSNKENVINQGLFYLDWLVDHKGDFTLTAQSVLGADIHIDWSRPRLILVAESFSDYDKYAVNRIGSNIELWTYRKYGNDLIFLDALFITTPQTGKTRSEDSKTTKEPELPAEEVQPPVYTVERHLERRSQLIVDLFEQLRERILALAEEGEITEKANKMYIGYQHGKNFAEVHIQSKALIVWLDIPPAELDDPYHLVRDVSKIGHYGTGNSEIRFTEFAQIDKIMPLVEQSYRQTI